MMCNGETLYYFRQSFILLPIVFQSLSNGILLGFPAVLNSAILTPESDIRATPDEASWLASVLGMTGLVGFLFLSPIMQIYGRKPVIIMKNCLQGAGWIILYYARSLTTLFIGRAIQGISVGGIFLNNIILSEYVHPCRRGYFTTILKISVSIGTLISHLLPIWLSWRQLALIAVSMLATSIFLTCFWKESPFFLAFRGRYEECEQSFHWLNGRTTRTAELKELIQEQKKNREEKKMKNKKILTKLFTQLARKDFLKSFLVASLLIVTMDLSGRNYFKAYVVQIMMNLISGPKSIAVYISVVSDVTVLSALLLSCVAVKRINRRFLLFSCGGVSIAALYIISLILYFKSSNMLIVSPWWTTGLILFVNFIAHIGVSPICFIVLGEIFPLELKGLGCCLTGLVFTISYGFILKLTPVFMESIGLGATYFIYSSGLFVCLTILYVVMPETKDKPLLDIEHNLQGVTKTEVTESLLGTVTA